MIGARCLNHADRESVARCPECRRSFCRECITEHEGRVICARCLARLLAPVPRPARSFIALTHPLAVIAGVLSAWLLFYGFGWLILNLPADVHDGTRWRTLTSSVSE